MKRLLFLVLVAASVARADHGTPTTRPVRAAEPDVAAQGESAPVEMEKDGYKAKLTWFPATPKPGDLIRYRLVVTVPGGGAPTLSLKAQVSRTGPGEAQVLRPNVEVPAEATPQDGRYVWTQVVFVPGTYQVTVEANDLEQGKQVRFEFPASAIGEPSSKALLYGIGIGGAALFVILIAFGLRRPSAD